MKLRRLSRIKTRALLLGILPASVLAMSGRITRSLSRMTRSAFSVKQGDISSRIPEESEGELRSLEAGFNEKISALQHSQASLRHQVEQATRDLRETMDNLEARNVELDLANKRAIATGRARSRILASVSHEIRTPLNGVIGFTRLLLHSELSAEQREIAETIRKSSTGLLSIINNILDYSKLEFGTLEPQRTPFRVRSCFEEPVHLLAPSAHEKGLELVLLIYSDVPEQLIGDETRIRQILINLIGNAIKFTHEGEVIVRVMIAGNEENACVLEFTVTDTGIGIPDDVQQQLFTSFHQGHRSQGQAYDGMGLGLSICRKLAESMQGNISVQSEENRGTCLRVVLNMGKADDGADEPRARPYEGKSCLLLDDHLLSRLSIRHPLKALGFEVSEGTLDTWPAAEKANPDLLVLGLTGEQLGNPEIEDRVKSIRKRIGAPTLALLSSSESTDLSRIQQAAGARCLSRPVAETNLQRTLAEIISGENLQPVRSDYGITPRLSGCRFLVADDDSINLHLMSSILRESGAEVVEAGNGQEILDALGHAQFDLIFLDMRMPVLDGSETARRIRSMDTPARDIPIVAVTADIVQEHRDRALGAGINDYLIKPVDEQQIWEAIRHLLYRGTGAFDGEPLPEPFEETGSKTAVHTGMQQASGRQALEDELYRRFLDSLPIELNTMYRHYNDRDWMGLTESAHRLHGASAVCAVRDLELLAGKLELAADNAREDQAGILLKQIDRESRRLMENTAAAQGSE